jgi:saccharopine dehydrogenase-like NADP-dependent oxidoreductase
MTNILVFGAGKSSSFLIRYLLEHATKFLWHITVADANMSAAIERVGNSHSGTSLQVNIIDDIQRQQLIIHADLVISLLPPHLHHIVAKDCLELKKNLITASYVSNEIKAMHQDAQQAGLLFMNEIGLDPGIDHMSAMKIIDEIERLGGDITSFKSYCGGLIAPNSDNNPWHYKISWNPRNILNAGKSGAHFLEKGIDKKLNYNELFQEYEIVQVPNFGKLAAYANRDSLNYKDLYRLDAVKTMLRATFRYEDFCIGWNAIIQLGLIIDNDSHAAHEISYQEWFQLVTQHIKGNTFEDKIYTASNGSKLAVELINWLGLTSTDKINLPSNTCSADIVLKRIEEKWKMDEFDKDLIVMHHEFEYDRKTIKTKLTSTLLVEGDDKTYTAMAKTVGLPMAIFTKLFLTGKIKNITGVQIPIMKEVYKPILKELTEYGIDFKETYLD